MKFERLFRRSPPVPEQGSDHKTEAVPTVTQPLLPPQSERDVKQIAKHERYIGELKIPLENILSELREDIENGSYSAIVGDDASGRIPTLILGDVIKNIYRERGFSPPLIRFIAGSSVLGLRPDSPEMKQKRERVVEQMRRIKADIHSHTGPGNKVLIVTDYISSGTSIEILTRAATENELPSDVATVGFRLPDAERMREISEKIGARVVAGEGGEPNITREPKIAGVSKKPEDLFAKPVAHEHPELQQGVNEARRLAKIVAQDILRDYHAGTLEK